MKTTSTLRACEQGVTGPKRLGMVRSKTEGVTDNDISNLITCLFLPTTRSSFVVGPRSAASERAAAGTGAAAALGPRPTSLSYWLMT